MGPPRWKPPTIEDPLATEYDMDDPGDDPGDDKE